MNFHSHLRGVSNLKSIANTTAVFGIKKRVRIFCFVRDYSIQHVVAVDFRSIQIGDNAVLVQETEFIGSEEVTSVNGSAEIVSSGRFRKFGDHRLIL